MGSLLWDLQNPHDPADDGPPLLGREFAFIDVGVSRARVATALHSLLSRDLGMDVNYVATERPEAIPIAHVTPVGSRAEMIRSGLNRMISSKGGTREVVAWHFTVDHRGKVASIAYRYDLHGNEIWEAYFMGRPFLYAGETMEFSYPELDCLMAPVVAEIEERMDRHRIPDQSAPCWEGFRVERNPLQTGLTASGIPLQTTDVPQRIAGKQNVLFLGNVLNQYPQHEQARELDAISCHMAQGDLVIVQSDEAPTAGIDIFQVTERDGQRTLLRVRRINTMDLEVHLPGLTADGWRRIGLKPEVQRAASQVMESLSQKANFTEWHEEARQRLIQRYFIHVFATFFRAMPVAETLRVATCEVLRRLPPMQGLTEIASPRDQPNNEKRLVHT